MKRILSFLAIFFSLRSFATELSVAPAIRTYPVSTSVEVSLKDDFLFWGKENLGDQNKFWQFGYLQPRLAIAAHGLAEASLQFAPISILEFSSSYSRTSRFYETKPFDCTSLLCKGLVDRSAWGIRLALSAWGYQSLLAYKKTKISNRDDSQRTVDESEVLWTEPGQDELESSSIYLSKLGTPFGIYARKSRYLGAQVGNEAAYFVLRHKMTDKMDSVTYALGMGRYASDFSVPQLSVYASVIWEWTLDGKNSVALF